MGPTFLQSFSQIAVEENFQSCFECFGDFPAPRKRTRRAAAVTIGLLSLTNVGVGDASMVNSSTLCVIGVGQKRAASVYGGQNMALFMARGPGPRGPKARGLGRRPEA